MLSRSFRARNHARNVIRIVHGMHIKGIKLEDTGSSWSDGIIKFPFCWKSFLNVGAR